MSQDNPPDHVTRVIPIRQSETSPPTEKPHDAIHYEFSDPLGGSFIPPRYSVKGWIYLDTLTEIFGDPESGKSLIALSMSLSIANGFDWSGCRVKPGQTFYIAGEGLPGIRCRIKAWCDETGGSTQHFHMLNSSVPLTQCDHAKALSEAIARQWDGFSPVTIVVDTLARNFGGDENGTTDMGLFIANCDVYLRQPFQASVIVLHHPGHGDKGRSRGNSSLYGAVDVDLKVEVSQDIIMLSCRKMKDGRKPAPLGFDIQSVDVIGLDGQPITDEDGDLVTAPLLCSAEIPEKPKMVDKDIILLNDIFHELLSSIGGDRVLVIEIRERFNNALERSEKIHAASTKRSRWRRIFENGRADNLTFTLNGSVAIKK